MSEQYPGGFITKTLTEPTTTVAKGMWTLSQAAGYRKQSLWPTSPDAPTIGTATAGTNANASVTFTAPANTGSATITGYTVTSSPGGFTGTGVSSPITVSGLTIGTSYTFTVTATNGAGTGPSSAASNSITAVQVNYIEEVFSTYLYTGNGATQTLTNGINLSGFGGLVWGKSRSNAYDNFLADSVRGSSKLLYSNNTYAQQTDANVFTAFNSNGFSLGVGGAVSSNTNGATYASWAFREQPKFFDVVTYTGNGVSGRVIPSNHDMGTGFLGAVFIKRTDTTSDWKVSFRGGQGGQIPWLSLNQNVADSSPAWVGGNINPEVNGFSVYDYSGDISAVNANGGTYVAYLFAHNAGGFGLNGTDNVITCGTYTGNGLLAGPIVTLGYEPQWVLVKRTNSTGNWMIQDNMRSLSQTNTDMLFPNLSNAATTGAYPSVVPTATGFYIGDNGTNYNASGGTYVYMAIRRGPMAVPTLGTTVFEPVTSTSANDVNGTLQAFDMGLFKDRNTVANNFITDRLRGFTNYYGPTLYTNLTNAEATPTTGDTVYSVTSAANKPNGQAYFGGAGLSTDKPLGYSFKRAPGFFDVVAYTGTGGASQTFTHNLGVAPELIIVKARNSVTAWESLGTALSASQRQIYLNRNQAGVAVGVGHLGWNGTDGAYKAPTSTVVYFGGDSDAGGSGLTYVAYLFATLAGVSKVGTYTGTGATQTIACNFAAGARFVLIKRTDTTGDWYYWDSVRGMVAGTDPSLLLNTTAAEVNANSIYAITTGFQIVSTAAGINASGGTYIFLAIA